MWCLLLYLFLYKAHIKHFFNDFLKKFGNFCISIMCRQLTQAAQAQPAPPVSQSGLLRMPHNQSPLHQASSSSSNSSSSSSALSVGQLVSSKYKLQLNTTDILMNVPVLLLVVDFQLHAFGKRTNSYE